MLCQFPFTRLDSSQDCKKLQQFLDFCRQRSIEDDQTKIVSIALEIEAIDPLVALHKLAQPHQLHFYFENRDKGQAIAAIGAAISLQAEGAERFLEAQSFIQNHSKQLISNSSVDSVDLAWTTPRFFCSFTFFDELDPEAAFPSATIFLPQWQITSWQNQSGAIANVLINSESKIEELTQTIWHQFQALRLAQYDMFYLSNSLQNLFNQWKVIDTHNFKSTVISALASIQDQQLDKLVLAHAIDVISQLPFQRECSLHNLRQLHPDCCVFSTGNGKGQSFIGASPERLLSLQNGKLLTDALAGSAPRGRTLAEDADLAQRLLNSEKEQWEHRVVVNFITQRLLELELSPKRSEAPGLLQLSNIQHLHTPIQAIAPSDLHPLKILAELHPTPAVAGVPRDIACQHIQHYEQFARSLYAAPLGWVDARGNAEFIVGIRSALIDGHRARLYAGAGIVAGSDPDRELAEVKLKLQALLRALV
jgi:menaquinone-specific isochorismate synthase